METLKNLVYSGVGLVSITTEKFRELVEQLVDERKLSNEEGKKIMDEFFNSTEDKKEDFENQMTGLIEKVMKTFNFATSSDVTTLEERVKVLEAKKGAAPTTKTKTTTRKKTTATTRKPAAKKTTAAAKKVEA